MSALLLALPWWAIVLIVIGALLVAFVVFTMTYGKKLQRQQASAEEQMNANKQKVDILVIDKQKLRMKDAGLPEVVTKAAPKYAKIVKMPIVKAKVGQRVMTLMADNDVYNLLPVKKICTVMISGLYIVEIKGVRGASLPKAKEKKGLLAKLRKKVNDAK